jgi:hypothetical protein
MHFVQFGNQEAGLVLGCRDEAIGHTAVSQLCSIAGRVHGMASAIYTLRWGVIMAHRLLCPRLRRRVFWLLVRVCHALLQLDTAAAAPAELMAACAPC